MASAYADHCHDKPRSLGTTSKDALAAYGLNATMLDTYTLLIGLGMRESSGKYCEGRDLSAGNVKSDEAEAGMFQASWNSSGADAELKMLFDQYSKDQSKCKLTLFAQGVTCKSHDAVNYGTGTGLAYQKLAKSCPAFAVDYAAVLVRVLKAHFGPINRKEAQIVPECRAMLEKACM